MNAIVARLGLDAGPMRSELRAAEGDVRNFGARMNSSLGGVERAGDSLLMSNHRVAIQMQHFSRTLLSGGDAASIFSGGLDALERSSRLPLGALVGLGVGAVGIQQISKMVGEYNALNKELDDLSKARPPGAGQTTAELSENITKINATLEKAKSRTGGLWNAIQDNIIGQAKTVYAALTGKALIVDPAQQRAEKAASAEATRGKDIADLTSKMLAAADAKGGPAYMAKAIELESKLFDLMKLIGPAAAIAVHNKDQENLADEVAQKRRERLQLSFKELSDAPAFESGMSPAAWLERDKARRVSELEDQVHEAVFKYHDMDAAQLYQNRADDIRGGMSTLKDTEKDLTGEFKGALDASAVLQQIRDGVNKFSFGNQ
jgi:hypothetical protein